MKYTFPADDRLSAPSNIQQVHHVLLRMLKILQQICDAHDIKFWLEYGTMLGAVRHQGFIPWDYEADIGMTRDDYDKLLQVVHEFPPDIFFQTKDTDPAYAPCSVFLEGKLRDKYSNYSDFKEKEPTAAWHNGIQVDIFVYDLYSIDEEEYILLNNFERVLTGSKAFFKLEEIEELQMMDFADTVFLVPVGYDAYLKRNYGDYLSLPPLEEQVAPYVEVTSPCDHKEVLHWQ
nr:LicD family protein [uncultured Chitinophaga sp.]